MSRIGKLPITLPSKVTFEMQGKEAVVKGAKGELRTAISGEVSVALNDGKIVVTPANDSSRARTMWGTTRAVLANMVKGVSDGFSVRLEISGVGYRAAVDKGVLTLALGFSHEIKYAVPQGITVVAEKPTTLLVSGFDKQKVGQVAAVIRSLRKPEPYKQKGIRREDEKVRVKEGKKK